MKWARKFDVDVETIHALNMDGYSLPELSQMFGVPRTTLNRYLIEAGHTVLFNRHRGRIASWKRRHAIEEFSCSFSWKRALLELWPHKCAACDYVKIVEAHHVVPTSKGGKSTRDNGILLCPNHHAEAHAGLLDEATLKILADSLRAVASTCDIDRVAGEAKSTKGGRKKETA